MSLAFTRLPRQPGAGCFSEKNEGLIHGSEAAGQPLQKPKQEEALLPPRSLSPGVSEGENNRITVETIWKEKAKKEKPGLEPNGHSLKIKGFVTVLKSVPPVDTFPPQFERV